MLSPRTRISSELEIVELRLPAGAPSIPPILEQALHLVHDRNVEEVDAREAAQLCMERLGMFLCVLNVLSDHRVANRQFLKAALHEREHVPPEFEFDKESLNAQCAAYQASLRNYGSQPSQAN